MIGRPDSGNRAVLDNALTKANVHLNWVYEVNNLTTSLGLVDAGLGASVLPRLATTVKDHSSVVTRPISSPVVFRTLRIVERRKGHLSAAAQIFRDMLIKAPRHPRAPVSYHFWFLFRFVNVCAFLVRPIPRKDFHSSWRKAATTTICW